MTNKAKKTPDNPDEIWEISGMLGITLILLGIALPLEKSNAGQIVTLMGSGITCAGVGAVGKLVSCCMRAVSSPNQPKIEPAKHHVSSRPPALAASPTLYIDPQSDPRNKSHLSQPSTYRKHKKPRGL